MIVHYSNSCILLTIIGSYSNIAISAQHLCKKCRHHWTNFIIKCQWINTLKILKIHFILTAIIWNRLHHASSFNNNNRIHCTEGLDVKSYFCLFVCLYFETKNCSITFTAQIFVVRFKSQVSNRTAWPRAPEKA